MDAFVVLRNTPKLAARNGRPNPDCDAPRATLDNGSEKSDY